MKRFAIAFLSGVAPLLYCGEALPEENLVSSHLRQARAIDATLLRDGDVDAFKAFIETKKKEWTARVSKSTRTPLDMDSATSVNSALDYGDTAACAAALQRQISLPLLLEIASRRNPAIRVARENVNATLQQYSQAAFLEDTLSQYRAFVREIETRVGPAANREMMGKTFPYPSSLALKGEIIDAQAEIAWQMYRQDERRALNDVARKFFTVQYLDSAVSLMKDSRKLFEKMEAISLELLKVGKVSQADSLRAQSTLALLDKDVLNLTRVRENAVVEANTLLDLPVETVWGALSQADLPDRQVSYDASKDEALRENQSLRIAREKERMAYLMVRLAETMTLPRGSKGMSQVALSAGTEAGPDRNEATTFPKREMLRDAPAGFGANAAYIDELRVRVSQAAESIHAEEETLKAKLYDAFTRVDIARRNEVTYRDAVAPKALQASETMRSRYNSASAPFIEYLDAGRSYLDATLKREEARRDHNTSLVDQQDQMGHSAAPLLRGR
jgi:outer membrane protein TolC